DRILWTERFGEGMAQVLEELETPVPVELEAVPRFNESEGHGPKRAHPVEDFFDDLAMHLVFEIYKDDFQLFRYDFDNPANRLPLGEIDLDEVHAKLGD
ncbi:MAG: sulfotransferase family 2 domain-containing protein, partial [Pseudomonadota bacterium]